MAGEKTFSFAKRKSGTFKKRSRPQFDTGKRQRRDFSRDHTSTTTKPIDTLYRILCPAKKIGSVLGKGGEIVNALRDQTHAKIRVADAIPGAEDRVIIIFSYPTKESELLDADQDPENAVLSEDEYKEIRPHCPAQDALLKVHDRITADESLRGGLVHEKIEFDGEVAARILVPNNQVGCLLGKGGTIIKKLRYETGAGIQILPAEHLPPCAMDTDQLVRISGLPDVVKNALYEVSTMLHQHPRKENPPLEELIFVSTQGLYRSGASMPLLPQGNPGWPHQHPGAHATLPMPLFGGHRNDGPSNEETAEEFSMRILCATGKIGGVIGKGGVVVRQLEQQTGAKVKVEDSAPEVEERVILVTSKEAPWDQISPTIDAVLQLQSRTSAISEDGIVTTRLLVPSSKVGCILGQGGNIITEMRRRTRAEIRVFPKDDKPKYASDNEELIQISGDQTVAREALFEIASRLRTRTLRPGNTAVNPAALVPFHGFAHSESMPGRDLPPYGMMGAENNAGYRYSKVAGPINEAKGYRGPPTAAGYSAGPRHETQGYPGPLNPTEYSAGPRQEVQGYPGPPTAAGYSAGPKHDAQGHPGAAVYTGYGAGQSHEAQGYSGEATASGYSAGKRHETQGYPGPISSGYSAGPWHETQGYPNPTAATYSSGPRHEAHGYPGTQATAAYSAGPRHEAQGYPGTQTAAAYSAVPRHEAQGYPGPPNTIGYPNINSSVEVMVPNSAVPSLFGAGGGNISDIHQISGARVKLNDPISGASECIVEIHGSSEQTMAAQSLLQSFITSGGQNAQLPPQVPRHY